MEKGQHLEKGDNQRPRDIQAFHGLLTAPWMRRGWPRNRKWQPPRESRDSATRYLTPQAVKDRSGQETARSNSTRHNPAKSSMPLPLIQAVWSVGLNASIRRANLFVHAKAPAESDSFDLKSRRRMAAID